MSFGTTYFAPAPMGRPMDFVAPSPRQSFHQRSCSRSAYSEDILLAAKLEDADPRDYFPDDREEVAGPGEKQPRNRMRLQRILNGSSEEGAQQQHSQEEDVKDGHPAYAYQSHSPSLPSFPHSVGAMQASSFPMSPCSPMPVSVSSMPQISPGGSPLTNSGLTMSSPMTTFSAMSQPQMVFDQSTMAYSYNQGYPPQAHYHQYSPDPSGSPTSLSPPERSMESLVDHSYAVSDSPPSPFYHGGAAPHHHVSSPYNVGPHSPMSNGPYGSPYLASGPTGSSYFTPTPPTTPHYGFSHPAQARYAGTPVYEHPFTLQSQGTDPRSSSHGYFSPAPSSSMPISPSAPSTSRSRKGPYEPRTPKTSDGSAAPRRFQCGECDKAFPTKGELASHSRCHLKVPAFLCGICGRPFKRRTDYVRHVRNVHEEVGRYGCGQCGERFGRLDKLKRHDKRGCGADKEDDEK